MKKALLVVVMMLIATPALAQGEGNWKYALTPYLWGISIDGTMGVNGVNADVEASFSDAIEFLDTGFMAAFDAWNTNGWGYHLDVMYISLKDSYDLPRTVLTAECEQMIIEGAVMYSPAEMKGVDLFLGGRYFDLENDIEVVGFARTTDSKNWIDPIVGARYIAPVNEKIDIILRGDVGGFGVGSEMTYVLGASVGYAFTPSVSGIFGYRYMDVDYDDDGFVYDMTQSGFGLGVTFKF